jgi:hypothetical protein
VQLVNLEPRSYDPCSELELKQMEAENSSYSSPDSTSAHEFKGQLYECVENQNIQNIHIVTNLAAIDGIWIDNRIYSIIATRKCK